MIIEKITKYVVASSPSRSSSNTFSRTIPMSIPRVRWLERDGSFKPAGKPEPVNIDLRKVKREEKKEGPPPSHMPRVNGLTHQENAIYELAVKGMEVPEIAKKLKMTENRVRIVGREVRKIKGDIPTLRTTKRPQNINTVPCEKAFRVYEMIQKGMLYDSISKRLQISKDTVRSYKYQVIAYLEKHKEKQ